VKGNGTGHLSPFFCALTPSHSSDALFSLLIPSHPFSRPLIASYPFCCLLSPLWHRLSSVTEPQGGYVSDCLFRGRCTSGSPSHSWRRCGPTMDSASSLAGRFRGDKLREGRPVLNVIGDATLTVGQDARPTVMGGSQGAKGQTDKPTNGQTGKRTSGQNRP